MSGAVEQRARQGRKFGPAAADYERGRPGYPAAAVARAAAGLELGPQATVVDLGAGTGKLTRQLVEQFARVIAVEPLPELREVAAAQLPGLDLRDGVAERLPLPDGTAQAVFVAEAFHWFDGPAALAEIARVLAPGGGVALMWNLRAGPSDPPLPQPARELLRSAVSRGGEPGGPLLAGGQWRESFAGSAFGPLHHEELPHELRQDRDDLVAHLMSVSSLAGLPAGERDQLRGQLGELLAPGSYRLPLRTDLYWARLAPVRWCARCGGGLAEGPHASCAAAAELEPPRYCRHCRRRMVVQVLPAGWSATCSAHGRVLAR